MKRKLYLLIIVLGAMILASGKALGNDYLESNGMRRLPKFLKTTTSSSSATANATT